MLLRFALFMMAFCGYLVPLMLPILAPQIARDLNTTVGAVGMVSGMQFLLAGGTSFLMGSVAHRFSKRRLALGFLMAAAVSLVGTAFSPNFDVFIVVSLLSALAYGSLLFFALAAVSDHFAPEQRAELSGMVTSALFMATLFGVPLGLGVGMISDLGWRAALLCVGGLFVLTFVTALRYLPDTVRVKDGGAVDFRPYVQLLRLPNPRAFFGLTFLARFGSGLYMTYIPAYLLGERGFPAAGFMLTFAASGALAFFTSRAAGRVLKRSEPAYVLKASIAALVATVLLITYFPVTPASVVPIVLAICLGYAAAESFRMTGLNLLAVTRGAPSQRQHLLGGFSLLLSFGYAIGAIVGGWIMMAFNDDVGQGFIPILWVAIAAWVGSAVLISTVARPWTFGPDIAPVKELA